MNRIDKINGLVQNLYKDSNVFCEILEEVLSVVALEFNEFNEEECYECLLFLIDAIKNYDKQRKNQTHCLSFIEHCKRCVHLNLLIYRQSKMDYPNFNFPKDNDIYIPSMNVLIVNEQLKSYVNKIKKIIKENIIKQKELIKTDKNI